MEPFKEPLKEIFKEPFGEGFRGSGHSDEEGSELGCNVGTNGAAILYTRNPKPANPGHSVTPETQSQQILVIL